MKRILSVFLLAMLAHPFSAAAATPLETQPKKDQQKSDPGAAAAVGAATAHQNAVSDLMKKNPTNTSGSAAPATKTATVTTITNFERDGLFGGMKPATSTTFKPGVTPPATVAPKPAPTWLEIIFGPKKPVTPPAVRPVTPAPKPPVTSTKVKK